MHCDPLEAMKKRILRILLLCLFALAVTVAVIVLYPHLKGLGFEMTAERLVRIKAFLDRFGFLKYLMVLAVQILQVIVAFIPGEPVEILAGYMCGTVGGLIVSLLGVALGTAAIYFMVRRLGKGQIERIRRNKSYERLKFLQSTASRDGLLFLLFFIPGTPKDFLTYFSPILQIGLSRLLLIITVARIPSVLSSTYLGAHLSRGDLAFSILIFAITAAIGAIGIVINDLILDKKSGQKR